MGPCFSIAEVRTFFSWTQWALDVVLHNRQFVLLNMDETSLPMVVTKKRGHVVHLPRGAAREHQCERVTSRDSRGNMTLVAFICSPGALQAQLPQYLLTRDKMLTAIPESLHCGLTPLQQRDCIVSYV